MNKVSALRIVDRTIVTLYVIMLVPIFLGLGAFGHQKIEPSLLLGYFSDIIAVIAALYGGRAVFLTSSQSIKNGNVACQCVGDEKREASKTVGTIDTISPTTLETPERTFFIMFSFLIVYMAIKISILFEKINNFQGILLIVLMNISAIMFAYFAFVEFQKDEKFPFWRFLLAPLAVVGSAIITVWTFR